MAGLLSRRVFISSLGASSSSNLASFSPLVRVAHRAQRSASHSHRRVDPLIKHSPNSTGPAVSSGPAVPAHSFACEKSALTTLYQKNAAPFKEHAFFVNDLGIVERQYKRWCDNLPNVRPFYAVKCNPDAVLLKALSAKGAGFDCASGAEIEAALKTGVRAEDIIFANPIKNFRDLKYARSVGVKKMTFDNEDELFKIKEHHPEAELVLRLLPDDSGSLMRFGVKFGAPFANIEPMLKTAQRLNLNIIGCSFHIGSGCFDPNKYMHAIELAKTVFTMAENIGLPKFRLLDLGGGFPGNPVHNARTPAEGGRMTPAFEEFASVIRAALEKYFPKESGVEVIAEPGRYMATAWSTLFTLVQGKRAEPRDPSKADDQPKKFLYYINDGVYGSFNCLMFDHAHPVPVPSYRFMTDKIALEGESGFVHLKESNNASTPLFNAPGVSMAGSHSSASPMYAHARGVHNDASSSSHSSNCLGTFFGPTCDSMDVIATDMPIEELHVGDWLAFEQFGAYTSASSSTFNGMERPHHHYVHSYQPSPSVH